MGELEDLTHHAPVLLEETIAALQPRPDAQYIDATIGGGGHSARLLELTAPQGRVLGLDRDPQAVLRARQRLAAYGARAVIVHSSYDRLAEQAEAHGFMPADGIVFDLGFSSYQIDDPQRGFAFRTDGPLDMRYDPTQPGPTAEDLVNELSVVELAALLRLYGEEPRSQRIAQAIVAARPIRSTAHLAQVVQAVAGRPRRGGPHPATLTFQALRIAVNRELEVLAAALPQVLSVVRPGGRVAIITFHSLEDRLVKQWMQREAKDCLCPPEAPVCTCKHRARLRLVTAKPITPSAEEVAQNPRSRSAKLRVAEVLPVVEGGA